MATLPTPGGDSGTWGTELNEFLSVAHNADGTAKGVVHARDYASLALAYAALPANGGVVVLDAGQRWDVGAGLVLDRTKKVSFVGPSRWHRGNPSITGTDLTYAGNEPVIFSSGTPTQLVSITATTGGAFTNGYGFTFTGIVFEMTKAATLYGIYAPSVCRATVRDCWFWSSNLSPAGALGIYAPNDAVYGNDVSWWKIEDNIASRCALVALGQGATQSNQNVVQRNIGFGRGATVVGTASFVALWTNHRSAVRDNNVEWYNTGIYLYQCYSTTVDGDGGEQTKTFVHMDGCAGCYVAPLGISTPAGTAGARLVLVDNGSTNNIIVAPPATFSSSLYGYASTAVVFGTGSTIDSNTLIGPEDSHWRGPATYVNDIAIKGGQTITPAAASLAVYANTAARPAMLVRNTGAAAMGAAQALIDVANFNAGDAGALIRVAAGGSAQAINATGPVFVDGVLRLVPRALPATCTVGDLCVNSTGNKLMVCTAANVWTVAGTQT